MLKTNHTLLLLTGILVAATSTRADTVISETFSGSDSIDLVGAATPDGNNWTGGKGEHPEAEKPADGTRGQGNPVADTKPPSAPRFSIRQDGSTGGIPFTVYHKFTLKQGRVYTLTAELFPSNKFDNQWFSAGFCVSARDGGAAPQQDGCKTYGQTVLSGSGYRYGWAGPDTKDMCELKGPGLHHGPVKVVLDTSNAKDYTIELFDGKGDSMHGPKSIGTPAISQVFLGNSGTNGTFGSCTLTDDIAEKTGAEKTGANIASTAPVIVMLGDSTTDQGLPWVVLKQLAQRIDPSLGRKNMINAGKGGDTASAAVGRLERDVLSHKPDIVTVSFGLNDTGTREPEKYGNSLKEIVRTLKAADIQVVLMTSTPFNNDRHFWAKREAFRKLGGLDEYMDREFCERMRRVAGEEGVPLCDLHAIFRSEIRKNPELIDKLISPDGVHLTADGLELMAEHLVPILGKLLRGDATVSCGPGR